MNRKKKLKLLLVFILLFIAMLIGYKVYLYIYETDYEALNADHIAQIESRLNNSETFSFAVVGNVQNSMRIFERRIAPLIKDHNVDFIVSAGNAVYDGTEAKYRLLYRGFNKTGIPYILTAGHNEIEDFGANNFYRHFGPYFYSFHLDNTYFIFLDSTGQTSWKWQLPWLQQQLMVAEKYPYRFVFLGHALFSLPGTKLDDIQHVLEKNISLELQTLFTQYRVTSVFSAGHPIYHETVVKGVRYIESGGGGGLLLGQETNYQFVKVNVGPEQTVYKNITVSQGLNPFSDKVETLKLFLHSFFYMNIFNSLLIISIISLMALKIYSLIIRQEHLYRDFNVDQDALSKSSLRVAMFTNNYLPFIGGVPLSITRIYRGLVKQGTTVKVFAPTFPQQWADPEDNSIFRCSTLFHTSTDNFPVANILSRKIDETFRTFSCDLVHVHHPFWLGKKGMKLARKHGIPVVLTYHTRLEHYMHYVPIPGVVLKNIIAHFLIKHFANRCDAIITPTASTEEYLRNLGVSSLIETIPTGIVFDDYKRWTPLQVQALRAQYVAKGERLLITVSRMAKEKNLDFLIDGLAKVQNHTHQPFKCLLVGDGPERLRLKQKVAELGMNERILFTGNMEPLEVIRCYLAADLFVFASTSETQGMVLVEAMAGGCPVVAVRASGVYDVVKDGVNGFKVAESTDSWAEAVANLLDNDQQLSLLSENSRVFAEDYSMEIITEKV
ncbi:MAG: glycosyltransferase, partial [Psychromonas sp.]